MVPGGVVFVAQEYQATMVSNSFTKLVYCFCEGIYQSVVLHLSCFLWIDRCHHALRHTCLVLLGYSLSS